MNADLPGPLDYNLGAVLLGQRLANLMGYIATLLPWDKVADVPGHDDALLCGDGQTVLLLVHAALLLGVVFALLLVDARLLRDQLAPLFGLDVTGLPGDIDAMLFGDVTALLVVLNMDGSLMLDNSDGGSSEDLTLVKELLDLGYLLRLNIGDECSLSNHLSDDLIFKLSLQSGQITLPFASLGS